MKKLLTLLAASIILSTTAQATDFSNPKPASAKKDLTKKLTIDLGDLSIYPNRDIAGKIKSLTEGFLTDKEVFTSYVVIIKASKTQMKKREILTVSTTGWKAEIKGTLAEIRAELSTIPICLLNLNNNNGCVFLKKIKTKLTTFVGKEIEFKPQLFRQASA